MGASEFTWTAFGKDAADAFRVASEEARHEHGHGGYTGSIAEKSGFKLISLPGRLNPWKAIDYISRAEDVVLCKYDTPSQRKDGERRFKKAVPVQHREWAKSHAKAYADKWGNALVIEIRGVAADKYRVDLDLKGKRGSIFSFFGTASC